MMDSLAVDPLALALVGKAENILECFVVPDFYVEIADLLGSL